MLDGAYTHGSWRLRPDSLSRAARAKSSEAITQPQKRSVLNISAPPAFAWRRPYAYDARAATVDAHSGRTGALPYQSVWPVQPKSSCYDIPDDDAPCHVLANSPSISRLYALPWRRAVSLTFSTPTSFSAHDCPYCAAPRQPIILPLRWLTMRPHSHHTLPHATRSRQAR